jgi:hypothetical protein
LGVFILSRREVDREDLIAEATALVERAELILPGSCDPVVAGFRRAGQWSLYFGSDPVYHFAADGALRRAFVDGFLYRSQGNTLSRLQRTRTESDVQLHRHDLTAEELLAFSAETAARIESLIAALQCGTVQTLRQIPPAADVPAKLLAALLLARRLRLAPALKS